MSRKQFIEHLRWFNKPCSTRRGWSGGAVGDGPNERRGDAKPSQCAGPVEAGRDFGGVKVGVDRAGSGLSDGAGTWRGNKNQRNTENHDVRFHAARHPLPHIDLGPGLVLHRPPVDSDAPEVTRGAQTRLDQLPDALYLNRCTLNVTHLMYLDASDSLDNVLVYEKE